MYLKDKFRFIAALLYNDPFIRLKEIIPLHTEKKEIEAKCSTNAEEGPLFTI
jgi:hypothetical protein